MIYIINLLNHAVHIIYIYIYMHTYVYVYVYFKYLYVYNMNFPAGSVVKESTCQVGDASWISGSERSPHEGSGKPLQYSCLQYMEL